MNLNPMSVWVLMMLARVSGFPKTPWQLLSDEEKKPLLKFPSYIPGLVSTLLLRPEPLVLDMKAPKGMTLEAWTKAYRQRNPKIPNAIKVGFFALNPTYSLSTIVDRFTRDVRYLLDGTPLGEPIKREKIKGRPGRRSTLDALNALGAMRLRYYCKTFAEAQAKMKAPFFYRDRRDFNSAANGASEHFRTFFKWIDSGSPLHSTNRGEK